MAFDDSAGNPTFPAESSQGDPAQSREGEVLDGKYRLVRLLGQGGMGSVYEARHTTLDRRFAVKFLLPQYAAQQQVLRRFEKEAFAAGGLEHPNLTAATDFGRAGDGSPYLVMEYLSGTDGAKLLETGGPLPVQRAANVVYQACRGLAVAHEANIIHRDLKPENLFITDAGDGTDLVKVLDFGIAKLRSPGASVATGTGMVMGTCFYMSPEQVRDSGKVDHRTDIWSLGVVLYQLVAGQLPFAGEDPAHVFYKIFHEEPTPLDSLRPDLPAEFIAVVQQAMKKLPDERFPTVTALADALAPFAGRTSKPPARSMAYRPTELASATAPASTSNIAIHTLSSDRGSLPAHDASGIGWRRLAVVAVVLGLVGLGLGALWFGSDSPEVASTKAPAESAGTLEPPTVANPPDRRQRSPAPSAVHESAPAPSASAAQEPTAPMPAPSPVRTPFEVSKPVSNEPKSAPAPPVAPPQPVPAPAKPPAETSPDPAPEPPTTNDGRTLSIDTDNPF